MTDDGFFQVIEDLRLAEDYPMCLVMNIACAGPDEPAPDDSKLPQFMAVDYVRVYPKK